MGCRPQLSAEMQRSAVMPRQRRNLKVGGLLRQFGLSRLSTSGAFVASSALLSVSSRAAWGRWS